MLDSKKCVEIYEYCQKQYGKLEKKEGRYSPKHDKLVMEMAAREFRMNEETINKAFDMAAHIMLKKVLRKGSLKVSFGMGDI